MNYNLVGTVSIDYTQSLGSIIYSLKQDLKRLWQSQYYPADRIVIELSQDWYAVGAVAGEILQAIQRVALEVDISPNFILVVTGNPNIAREVYWISNNISFDGNAVSFNVSKDPFTRKETTNIHGNNDSRPQIVFEVGAGGNHVRWLLAVDPLYQNTAFSGTSAERAQWIVDNVYTDRTWYSWLSKEKHLREPMADAGITLTHNYEIDSWNLWQDKKQLFLVNDNVDQIALQYAMFNLGMNNYTPAQFISAAKQWTKTVSEIAVGCKNKTVLLSDCLFDKELNYDWYSNITKWAGFDNYYDDAVKVHYAYYKARQRCAKEFVEYFTGSEFNSYLEFYKKFSNEDQS